MGRRKLDVRVFRSPRPVGLNGGRMWCVGGVWGEGESFSGMDCGEEGVAEVPKENAGHATGSRGDGCRDGAGVAWTVK